MHMTPDIIEGILEFSHEYDEVAWGMLAAEAETVIEAISTVGLPTSGEVFNALEAHFGVTH